MSRLKTKTAEIHNKVKGMKASCKQNAAATTVK
jgi:hypothetical protein